MKPVNRNPALTIIGDSMLDRYVFCRPAGLCKEADLHKLVVLEEKLCPGAAANVAMSVNALGCDTKLVSVVGTDAAGDSLIESLISAGIDTTFVFKQGETHQKNRVMLGKRLVSRFDLIPPLVDTAALEEIVAASCLNSDVILLSDYGYGVLTPALLDRLKVVAEDTKTAIVVDAKQPSNFHRLPVTVLKASLSEVLLDFKCTPSPQKLRIHEALECAEKILSNSHAQFVIVTVDIDGAVLVGQDMEPLHGRLDSFCADALSIGAGDAFIAILAAKLAAGCNVRESFEQSLVGTASAIFENNVTTVVLPSASLWAAQSSSSLVPLL